MLGEEVAITGKRMPNGEVRRRVKFADDTALHYTIAPLNTEWQNAHFHKGLTEVQLVISGKMAVVRCDSQGRSIEFFMPGEVCVSSPWHVHNVYLYPGSVLATITYGKPIGDPSRKGNDWWAADAEFEAWSKQQVLP